MLQAAVYKNRRQTLRVNLEKNEVLLESDDILNFPRIVPLEGGRLMLPYGRGRHGGNETRWSAFSDDGGRTWRDVPPESPWADNVQTSGVLGFLGDGTILYIDVFPREIDFKRMKAQGMPWYRAGLENPTWRLRYFSPRGELLKDTTFNVRGLPWKSAAYYCYGDLLQLPGGDLLATLGVQDPGDLEGIGASKIMITTFFVRSGDNGRTWEYASRISPWREPGEPFGPEGVCEPTTALLSNGDILCLMRTGGRTPLHQSFSTDGGRTWSKPESTGWPAAKPQLRLLGNGVLACSSGRGCYGHPQVTHAMFSLDGRGECWEAPFAFHTGPGCSYTSSMERDGRLYVVYSDSSFTAPKETFNLSRQAIRWAVLSVELQAEDHCRRR